jgi:hypothetical protein
LSEIVHFLKLLQGAFRYVMYTLLLHIRENEKE